MPKFSSCQFPQLFLCLLFSASRRPSGGLGLSGVGVGEAQESPSGVGVIRGTEEGWVPWGGGVGAVEDWKGSVREQGS